MGIAGCAALHAGIPRALYRSARVNLAPPVGAFLEFLAGAQIARRGVEYAMRNYAVTTLAYICTHVYATIPFVSIASNAPTAAPASMYLIPVGMVVHLVNARIVSITTIVTRVQSTKLMTQKSIFMCSPRIKYTTSCQAG